jgi:hypothetical protein
MIALTSDRVSYLPMKSLYTSSCMSVRQQLHGALPRQWDNALSSHQSRSPSVFSSQRTSFLGNELASPGQRGAQLLTPVSAPGPYLSTLRPWPVHLRPWPVHLRPWPLNAAILRLQVRGALHQRPLSPSLDTLLMHLQTYVFTYWFVGT